LIPTESYTRSNLSDISADLNYAIPSDTDQYENVYVSTDDAFLNLKERNKKRNLSLVNIALG
jgi:hypothetical protein